LKALFKLGIASTVVLIALIAICGLVASLPSGTPDVASAPGTPAPVLPAPSVPAEPDPERVAASSEAESGTPLDAATEPAVVTPPRPELDAEEIDYASLPEASLIKAVAACRDRKGTPENSLRSRAEDIAVDGVGYLFEGAEVQSVGTSLGIQLLLADGTTAFLTGVSSRGLVTGNSIVPGLVYVTDTAQYTTIFGAGRSGWVLRAISDSEWAKAEQAWDQIQGVAKRNTMREELVKLEAALSNQKPDKLVSADGKHTTEAAVIGYADGVISLVRLDGKEVSVPMERLDQRSQDIAKTRIGTRSRAKTRIAHIQKELAADE